MIHLPALVALLNVLLLAAVTVAVGRARGRHGIKAPAITGHPDFERAMRVHMNTIEATVIFLPTLWLAARYGNPTWAGIIGMVWLAGRIWYAMAYMRDATGRGPGFMLATIAWVVLLVLAAIGVIHALMLNA